MSAFEVRTKLMTKLQELVVAYRHAHQPDTALYWAGHLVALTEAAFASNGEAAENTPAADTTEASMGESETVNASVVTEARLTLAETLLDAGHPRRAAQTICGRGLQVNFLPACFREGQKVSNQGRQSRLSTWLYLSTFLINLTVVFNNEM